MKKPILVIMAAGMGSRYGGLKQIDPVDEQGHLIIDFSIYDAIQAGFEKIVFIIKREIEKDFKEIIGNRIAARIPVEYVYQDLNRLPENYTVPKDRVKPWGTGHAVLCCEEIVDRPFAVINADDYYGRRAFHVIHDYLVDTADDEKLHYAMVGYELNKTLTENGHVARGVCTLNNDNMLCSIVERTRIEKKEDGAYYTEDDGATYTKLPEETIVSMNLWGFGVSIFKELSDQFPKFLQQGLSSNPLKCEYFLPSVVGELLEEQKADVKVLKSADHWYGVTYKEDKEKVTEAIRRMKAEGLYPQELWEETK